MPIKQPTQQAQTGQRQTEMTLTCDEETAMPTSTIWNTEDTINKQTTNRNYENYESLEHSKGLYPEP